MTASIEEKNSDKVPLFSNAAAGGLTGVATLLIASWDGHISHFATDFSAIKPFALFFLPGLGMYIAYGIKTIGFKWSLGAVNRRLLRINLKQQKELKKDIKKYSSFISEEKILDLKKQLEVSIQDRHDIISNNYLQNISQRNAVQDEYQAHYEKAVNDNDELISILNSQNK